MVATINFSVGQNVILTSNKNHNINNHNDGVKEIEHSASLF